MGHIELARWAELILIAPTSADCIARLATGQADDLLTTLCLATTASVVLAPAMNGQMWRHPATGANCRLLMERGVRLLGPANGSQACGETGPGRMLEPLEIVAALTSGDAMQGLHVLITAGPTHEDLDPVRFLGNRSSGRMGFALAASAALAGARVDLVTGPVALATPPGVSRTDVRSALQMHQAVMEQLARVDIFIAAAAVADFRPTQSQSGKIKKGQDETMQLDLCKNPDILAAVAAMEPPPFTCGFAAETHDLARYAKRKLMEKGIDMIAANRVGGKTGGFDREDNELTVFWRGGQQQIPLMSKQAAAAQLLEIVLQRFNTVGDLSANG